MRIIDYRSIYESSVFQLLQNVTKDIAVLVAGTPDAKIDFKPRNKFKWGEKTICGISLDESGLFIHTKDSKFEIVDDNEEFIEFSKNPLNLIRVYEAVLKELKIKKNSRR
jgi:hypothetical protein